MRFIDRLIQCLVGLGAYLRCLWNFSSVFLHKQQQNMYEQHLPEKFDILNKRDKTFTFPSMVDFHLVIQLNKSIDSSNHVTYPNSPWPVLSWAQCQWEPSHPQLPPSSSHPPANLQTIRISLTILTTYGSYLIFPTPGDDVRGFMSRQPVNVPSQGGPHVLLCSWKIDS